jgi:uncharacterized membrane protein HdeD (DUF308 family)
MFDELRQQATEGDTEEPESDEIEGTVSGQGNYFLGMTPQQRFLLAVMFALWVCIMGVFCLLATGKVGF